MALKPKSLAQTGLINLFVFAEPGWGKTRLAGTSPGKVLLLRPPTDHTDAILPADKPRVREMVLRDWDDIWESMEYVRHEGEKWDWIWLDSISLLQDHGLDDIWDTVTTEKPQRKRYGLDKQEYGINFFRLAQYLRHLVGAEVTNFGMTAHTAWLPSSSDEDSEEPEEKLMPWVQGRNMSPKFCGYMNMVAYGDTDKKETRRLWFNNNQNHYGKDQFDAFADNGHKLVNPTMPKIVSAVKKARAATGASGRKKKPTRRRGGS
jgi:hypothetical protein